MFLGGYQKLTLIDYPGKIAATVFTAGCNFRCPFCHNPELVLNIKNQKENDLEKDFFNFLKKRRGKLEGVCVTGGEPTIQPDIISFLEKIKKLGYLVKIDSNGSNPDVLEKIIKKKKVDFIALDIKNSPHKYSKATGVKINFKQINRSVRLVMESGIDYEFRTTVVPGLHMEKDFEKIAEWIGGSKKYCLQIYQDVEILDPSLKQKIKGKFIDVENIRKKIKENFEKVIIRG